MAKKTHLLKLILTSLLLGADNGINATELMGQWYMTSSGDRLITYYGPKEECEVYGSLEAVNQTMEAVRELDETAAPTLVPDEVFDALLEHCQEVHVKKFLNKADLYLEYLLKPEQEEAVPKHTTAADLYRLNLLNSIMIFPGTKWCGVGSVASHFHDLGYHEDADRCCRGHDLCFDALMAGQCKNGLCNNSPYTRSPCTCDRQFVSCLKGAKTRIANALGRVFFNIGGMNCYKFDHPIKRCVEFVDVSKNSKVPTWLLKALHVHPEPQKPRCKQYELDFTKPKVWQFFETFYDETTHLIKDTSVRAPKLLKQHTKNSLDQLRGKTKRLKLPTNRNRPRNGAKKMSPFARLLVDLFVAIVDPYER